MTFSETHAIIMGEASISATGMIEELPHPGDPEVPVTATRGASTSVGSMMEELPQPKGSHEELPSPPPCEI